MSFSSRTLLALNDFEGKALDKIILTSLSPILQCDLLIRLFDIVSTGELLRTQHIRVQESEPGEAKEVIKHRDENQESRSVISPFGSDGH